MKAFASTVLGLAVVGIGGTGCSDAASAGSDCEDRLVARLPSHISGPYVFEGTADGARFRCTYKVVQFAPEANWVDDASCDADVVALELEGWSNEYGGMGDRVRAVFPGAPEVAWTWTDVDRELTRTGTLSADDRCREVEVEYP